MRLSLMPQAFGDVRNMWDFSNPNSVTLSSTKITQITDTIGGKTASQGTDSQRPTYTATQNGNNVATFNSASSQVLLTALATDFKFFTDGTSSEYTIVLASKTTADAVQNIAGNRSGLQVGAGVRYLSGNRGDIEIYNGSGYIAYHQFNQINSNFKNNIFWCKPSDGVAANRLASYVNGIKTSAVNSQTGSTTGTNPSSPFSLGGTTFSGNLGAVIIYNGRLNLAPERLGTFLKMKWGN